LAGDCFAVGYSAEDCSAGDCSAGDCSVEGCSAEGSEVGSEVGYLAVLGSVGDSRGPGKAGYSEEGSQVADLPAVGLELVQVELG
jgi:hypothetical protein